MCDKCNKIFILEKTLEEDQEILDLRGKKYLKQVKKIKKLFEKYFSTLEKEMLSELENKIAKTDNDWMEERQDDLGYEIEKTWKLGAKDQDKFIQTQISIGLSIGISDDKALEYAKTRIGDYITKIDNDTREEIKGIINQGMIEQKSYKDVAGQIQLEFSQFSEWRAQNIARTEASAAYSYGKRTQFEEYTQEFGVVGWKKNQSQGDSKVRASHYEAEQLGWVPYNHIYDDSDGNMQISNIHPPFSRNCRCVEKLSLFNPDTSQIR